LDSLKVDSPTASAAIIRKLLAGALGPLEDIVVLNGISRIDRRGKRSEPTAAAATAANAIDSGAAADLLARLAALSHEPA